MEVKVLVDDDKDSIIQKIKEFKDTLSMDDIVYDIGYKTVKGVFLKSYCFAFVIYGKEQ